MPDRIAWPVNAVLSSPVNWSVIFQITHFTGPTFSVARKNYLFRYIRGPVRILLVKTNYYYNAVQSVLYSLIQQFYIITRTL